MTWIVAVTKPNSEALAAEHLERQGFIHYCPKYGNCIIRKGRLQPVLQIKPLFPRYLFVEYVAQWHRICGTRGISYVLMGTDKPQPVADRVIEDLKSREEDGLYVMVKEEPFSKGEKLLLRDGPLKDKFVIYEGMNGHDRVRVLASLFDRQVLTEVKLDDVITGK